ncbi:AEC family transporter [Exercitatus varius]|uniref:AEC family transporter n=1 Tax=Exercitatus varius TaxID=67857 RepID=A0AAW6Q9Q6_9PAST|nr:AEC family transporter [Exercitatus varius]MDG2949047.1 AEC family transporter [Exercitatus varius]
MIFLTAIESVLSIVLIIGLGFYLRQAGWFADTFAANISKLIMNVALPASIFVSVLTYLNRDKLMSLSDGLLYGALSVVIGYLISWFLVKVLKVRPGRRGVFINTIVNANTIFIGLPLNVALFGDVSMPYFLVYYVLNTVSTWAFGALLIARDSSDPTQTVEQSQHFDWKKLLPAPLIGFLIALVFLLADIPVPTFIHASLSYVGAVVTPLSLIYIGIMLCDAGLKSIRFDKDTIAALLGKFVLAPVIMAILILIGRTWLPLPAMEAKTLIVQSSVSALAVLPILANEAKGDVQFATNLVTTSTILFIIVVPLVDALLQFL